MLLRPLNFGPVSFSSLSDKLSLHLEYEVVTRLPSGKLETLSGDECLQALTSGEIWVASGNSCRVDFVIDLDGKESLGTQNHHIIELLGRFVAESKVRQINTRKKLTCSLFKDMGAAGIIRDTSFAEWTTT